MSESITLYQPRHNYAAEEGQGHIYLPSSLATAAGRLLGAGADVDIQDGNLRKPNFTKNIVGANVVGAPYLPVAIELKKQIIAALGEDAKLILGGQVISGLTLEQFQRLFGANVFNGNNDAILKKLLGLELRVMPAPEETSLIPAYEKISDADFTEYLRHEFCLYLSQGCEKACSFCAADHTAIDPVTGKPTKGTERYRNLEIIETELKYMIERAQRLGINSFEIYLSNLDTFQTPQKLKQFAQIMLAIKKSHPDFKIKMRGLSTSQSFMEAYRKDKTIIRAMVDAGLWSIGFGVDGTSKEIWKSIKKSFNSLPECIEAIRLTREEFGITPEVFMIVGHGADTPETLHDDVNFALDMQEKFGAPPRPYVAKIAPGSPDWKKTENQEYAEYLISHPEYFQALEYGALPSTITHPDAPMRTEIIRAFHMLTSIPGNTTNIIYPITPYDDPTTTEINRRLNRGKTDR